MTTKLEAIISLKPGAEFNLEGDKIIWLDKKQTEPTTSEIDAEIARLNTIYENEKYKRDRAAAYPQIIEQLDMQYWDQVNGTTTWKDAIAKVKTDFPANPKP